MKTKLIYTLIVTAAFLAGCDSLTGTEHKVDYVVESYQVAMEPLAIVRLSRSAPLNTVYDFEKYAISGASVVVHLLGPDGSIEKSYPFAELASDKSAYKVAGEPDVVLPRRTYRLEVELPDSQDRITAQTTVPDTFRVASYNKREGVYQDTAQIEITITKTRSDLPQPVYAVSNLALDATEENMVPFIKNVYDRADGDIEIDDLVRSEAPLINEASFETQTSDRIVFDIPWLTIAFYGRQVMLISTVDRNLFDFIRSKNIQSGGSTLSPGEIPNILEHVEGGTGVFGSYSRVEFEYSVSRE